MSPDFCGCAMTDHPHQSVFILPKKVSASSDTTDVSPDMAARHHDTKNNARSGILSLLLSVIMLVKPSLVSAQASQSQGTAKEAQQTEQSIGNKNELNKQLLRHASSSGNEFIKTLYVNNALSKGADVNAVDEYGLNPLHHAINHGHMNIVKLLIAQGARFDVKDNAGRAPIHYAAEAVYMANNPQEWSVGMIRLLMDAGADINVKEDIGWTPLHYAAYTFKKYLTEVLVEKGADVDIVDNRGRTPSVVMQERVVHLETLRGSEFESTLSRDYRKASREISRLLYKNGLWFIREMGRCIRCFGRPRKIVRGPRGTNFPPGSPNLSLCPNDFSLQATPRT